MGSGEGKKEFILDGLDCANCAMKIEDRVSRIEGIDSCTVNFARKSMTVTAEGSVSAETEAMAKAAVEKIDPGIKVQEKAVSPGRNRQVFILEGLDCANCAAKIEKQAGQLAGVHTSRVDFVSKKLILNTGEADLQSEVEEIVRRLEPDVAVIPEEGPKQGSARNTGADGIKGLSARIAGSAVLLLAAVFTELPFAGTLVIFIGAYLLAGGDVLLRAVRNIFRGQVFDEHFLMALATLGAFAIGEYPEAVAVMVFYQVGELFQSMAVNKSRKSISALMDIRPEFARLKTAGGSMEVSPDEVPMGAQILVKPGEKIPLDGVVLEGNAAVDTSALTGESLPRHVEAGSEVLSGFINSNGVITVAVTKSYSESAVSKILELVENASSKKAPTENFITKFAHYYTPAVVVLALLLAFLPPLVLQGASLSDWVYRALVFLVISCPCALVVSIPLGFFGGIGGASKRGILIKGSNYLEALNDVAYVVFDKTGTLTKGVFEVSEMLPAPGISKEELLAHAAFAEAHSSHPIALSIKKAYGRPIDTDKISEYEEKAGNGIKARAMGQELLAGNRRLLEEEGIIMPDIRHEGTAVYIAAGGQYAGVILISDQVKEDAARTVAGLKTLGIKRTVMLTGDTPAAGEEAGRLLGIDEVHAGLLPAQKLEKLEELFVTKNKREKILFIGDGINDTPVLARADIGAAMGGLGSDAAIEAADLVIMNDEPSKLLDALGVAKKTRKIVWQNIIFALGVKAVFLLLGAFGIATMWEAVFSDVGVTVLAVLNSMRVLKVSDL